MTSENPLSNIFDLTETQHPSGMPDPSSEHYKNFILALAKIETIPNGDKLQQIYGYSNLYAMQQKAFAIIEDQMRYAINPNGVEITTKLITDSIEDNQIDGAEQQPAFHCIRDFSEPMVGLLNIVASIAKSIKNGEKAIYTIDNNLATSDYKKKEDDYELRLIRSSCDRGLAVFNEQTQQVAITNAGASILLKLLTECNKDIGRETNFSLRTFGNTDANAFRTGGRSDAG